MSANNPLPRRTLAYLATPFTKYPHGIDAAVVDATRLAGNLLASGINVYAPIPYCAALARQHGFDMLALPFWLPLEEAMCLACDVLIVARLDGWAESEGIAREVERFVRSGKSIYDLDPQSMRMTRRGRERAA